MGYFPNGSEGSIFEERFCERCIHQDGCPIWTAHLLYSYELCNETDHPGKRILDMLIPWDEKAAENKQCAMFIDKTKIDPLADHPELPFS